ncbi:t-SNARE affecting a late Golgi compartment protein 2 [Marasmius sp. AFHP31]|nr:t-SNARE affecting a late Golgi compartment protein 2 [Marasmius sp. AFHP31]
MSAVDDDVQAATHTQSQSLSLSQADPVDLQSRDREISEIAKSISSLAELFKDLSALVIDQGTLLDSVEYNIEQTAVQMDEAVKELNTATRRVYPTCLPHMRLHTYTSPSQTQFVLNFLLFRFNLWVTHANDTHADIRKTPGDGNAFSC